jgi:hypothetical protein
MEEITETDFVTPMPKFPVRLARTSCICPEPLADGSRVISPSCCKCHRWEYFKPKATRPPKVYHLRNERDLKQKRIISEETRAKLSKARKGKPPNNKGKPNSSI